MKTPSSVSRRESARMALLIVSLGLACFPLAARGAEDREKTTTQVLAELAIQTRGDDITPAAYEAAKRAVTDAIGAALAGHNAPSVREVLDQCNDVSRLVQEHLVFQEKANRSQGAMNP
jgi:hypothetical protein